MRPVLRWLRHADGSPNLQTMLERLLAIMHDEIDRKERGEHSGLGRKERSRVVSGVLRSLESAYRGFNVADGGSGNTFRFEELALHDLAEDVGKILKDAKTKTRPTRGRRGKVTDTAYEIREAFRSRGFGDVTAERVQQTLDVRGREKESRSRELVASIAQHGGASAGRLAILARRVNAGAISKEDVLESSFDKLTWSPESIVRALLAVYSSPTPAGDPLEASAATRWQVLEAALATGIAETRRALWASRLRRRSRRTTIGDPELLAMEQMVDELAKHVAEKWIRECESLAAHYVARGEPSIAAEIGGAAAKERARIAAIDDARAGLRERSIRRQNEVAEMLSGPSSAIRRAKAPATEETVVPRAKPAPRRRSPRGGRSDRGRR